MKRIALVIAVALSACQPSPGEEAMAEAADAARSEIDMVERGVALSEIFDGRCTDDCSGHRAGYLYAVQFRGDVRADCDTKSASFREGCEAGRVAASYQ